MGLLIPSQHFIINFVDYYQLWSISPHLSPSHLITDYLDIFSFCHYQYCYILLQSLRLFRLSTELEAKAATLHAEALQHMTVALAGSNCKELFTLLTNVFRKDTGVDPFRFLDGTPKIKPPLDLTDTDTEDETGDASSTTSTATLTPTTTSASSSQHKSPRVKPRKVWMDQVPDTSHLEGHLPTDPKALHNTGIPSIYHVRWSGASSKGSLLYDCPFGSACGMPPYVGDLPSCGSHVCCVHVGSSILCPYFPNQCYYNADNWWKHMWGEHKDAPWFIASAPTPATQSPADVTTTADTTKPPPFSTFTAPLPPVPTSRQEAAAEDTLPYVPEEDNVVIPEQTGSSEEWVFTPQDLQEDAAWEAQCVTHPELSKDEMKQFMVFAPSDTHQYDYAGNARSGIMTRYRKHNSKTHSLSQTMAVQDVAPPAPNPALEPGESPPRKHQIKEEVKVWSKETYGVI